MTTVHLGGLRQRGLHRDLLAAREFHTLLPDDKAALERLSHRDRVTLKNIWEPAGAEFGTHLDVLAGNPVFELQQTLHGSNDGSWIHDDPTQPAVIVPETRAGIRPDLVFHAVHRGGEVLVKVAQSDRHWVGLDAFDQFGELHQDLKVIEVHDGVHTGRVVPVTEFNVKKLADEISAALPRGA